MTYRDEKAALRARVASLETDLEQARATIARLGGDAPTEPPGPDAAERSVILDAPRRITLERTLDVEIGDRGFEEIAALLRPRLGAVSQVGRTLVAPGFTLETGGGTTHVRVTADRGSLAAGVISCSALVGGFLALGAFALTHDLFLRGLSEVHVLWMLPVFVLSIFPVMRRWFSRRADELERQQRATMELVVHLVDRHAQAHADAPRRRIAAPPTALDRVADDADRAPADAAAAESMAAEQDVAEAAAGDERRVAR